MKPATLSVSASDEPGGLRVDAVYRLACHNGCENLHSRSFQMTATGRYPPTVSEPCA